MDINLVNLTVHIDEDLSPEQRITVQDSLRALAELIGLQIGVNATAEMGNNYNLTFELVTC